MNREEYSIEEVDNNFSVIGTGCPNCHSWMCEFPDIKHLLKRDSEALINLLEGTSIGFEVQSLTVMEWTCNGCKTIFVNIKN